MSLSAIRHEEIARLKDILFRDERAQLRELSGRVLAHEARIGTEERLLKSVSAVLVDALKTTHAADHERLANTLAPLVVRLVRREIANSRDDLVEAIYPLLGRLVSAYVSRNLNSFVSRTDRKLAQLFSVSNLALRIKSVMTGVPYRDLMLKSRGCLRVEEILLIKKGAGTVIDRWLSAEAKHASARKGGEPDRAMMGGLLSAVSDFAAEALSQEGGELRALDLGESRLFLRMTPAHIVAFRCAGRSNPVLEKCLDAELVSFLGEMRELRENAPEPAAGKARSAIPALAERLNAASLQFALADDAARRRKPFYFIGLVSVLFAFSASLTGQHIVSEIRAATLEKDISEVVQSQEALRGYPIHVDVTDGAETITLSGVLPSQEAANSLLQILDQQLGIVPTTTNFVFGLTSNTVDFTLSQVQQVTDRLIAIEKALTEPVLDTVSQTVRTTGPAVSATVSSGGNAVAATLGAAGQTVSAVAKSGAGATQVLDAASNAVSQTLEGAGSLVRDRLSGGLAAIPCVPPGRCEQGAATADDAASIVEMWNEQDRATSLGEKLDIVDWGKLPPPAVTALGPLRQRLPGPLQGFQRSPSSRGNFGQGVAKVAGGLTRGAAGALSGSGPLARGGAAGAARPSAAGGLVRNVIRTPGRLLGRR